MLATLAFLLAAAPLPPCAALPPPVVQFAPGEQLKFRLDLLGADVGTFDVSLERAPGQQGAALALHARARPRAFVATNVGRYGVSAVSLLGKDLRPVKSLEEVDEAP